MVIETQLIVDALNGLTEAVRSGSQAVVVLLCVIAAVLLFKDFS